MDSELQLTVQKTGGDSWRVGLLHRATAYLFDGTKPDWEPISLGRLARSEDGLTIELSTNELEEELPQALKEGVLPTGAGGGSWGTEESIDTD